MTWELGVGITVYEVTGRSGKEAAQKGRSRQGEFVALGRGESW